MSFTDLPNLSPFDKVPVGWGEGEKLEGSVPTNVLHRVHTPFDVSKEVLRRYRSRLNFPCWSSAQWVGNDTKWCGHSPWGTRQGEMLSPASAVFQRDSPPG